MSSRHRSHRGTSSFDYHFYHSFVVFKDVKLISFEKNVCWWVRDPIHLTDQSPVFYSDVGSWFWNRNLPSWVELLPVFWSYYDGVGLPPVSWC